MMTIRTKHSLIIIQGWHIYYLIYLQTMCFHHGHYCHQNLQWSLNKGPNVPSISSSWLSWSKVKTFPATRHIHGFQATWHTFCILFCSALTIGQEFCKEAKVLESWRNRGFSVSTPLKNPTVGQLKILGKERFHNQPNSYGFRGGIFTTLQPIQTMGNTSIPSKWAVFKTCQNPQRRPFAALIGWERDSPHGLRSP